MVLVGWDDGRWICSKTNMRNGSGKLIQRRQLPHQKCVAQTGGGDNVRRLIYIHFGAEDRAASHS
jgi:hypothetical protein